MCNIDVNEIRFRFKHQNEPNVVTYEKPDSAESDIVPHPLYQHWLLHFASGAISGPISRTCTAPLDRMRLQIQIVPYKQSIKEAWKTVLQQGGILGLWRGNGINVCKVAPEMALRFGVYDNVKAYFASPGHSLTTYERFVAGSIAGVAGQLAIYPFEVLKTRMMIRKTGEFKNVFHCMYKIYKTEGLQTFYRGYLPSVAGMVPYTGVDLSIYETLRNYFILTNQKPDEPIPRWKLLTCASVSITCGQYCSYPFYLVKARLQAKSEHASIIAIQQTKGCQLCKIFVLILRTEGISGLYRGVLLTLGKVLPAGVINYLIYEDARRRLSPYFD